MPAPELSHQYQAAVYWAMTANSSDGYGQPTLDAPEEIRCRWDDTKRDVLDAQGMRVAVDATAYVDREITVGSELWLGQLDDWLGTGDGPGLDDPVDVMVVKTYNATPDVRNRYVTRVIGMMKKANTRNALS